MKKIRIEKTKKGFPAFWEKGGGYTNTGEATIIANKDGQPKKAIYVRRRGHLANENHALVILEVGDYIIKANHHRKDFEIEIYKVVNFESENCSHFSTGATLDTMTVEEFVSKYGNLENFTKLKGFLRDTYQIDEKTAAQSTRIFDIGELEILELKEETYEKTYAVVEQVNCFSRGEWDAKLPAYLYAAVWRTMEKATCYHCREPHFIIE
jgi:hypothetical protein